MRTSTQRGSSMIDRKRCRGRVCSCLNSAGLARGCRDSKTREEQTHANRVPCLTTQGVKPPATAGIAPRFYPVSPRHILCCTYRWPSAYTTLFKIRTSKLETEKCWM